MKKNMNSISKRVFVTREIPESGVNLLKKNGLIVDMRTENSSLTKAEFWEKAKDVSAIISMLSDQVDESFLKANPHLKVISNYAVGTNNIDVETASKLNIAIGNTPDVLTEATAEIAFGLMIACARNFKWGLKDAELGLWDSWQPMKYLGVNLKGKTLAIIGYGRIGRCMASLCERMYGMKVLATNSQTPRSEFLEILKKADVISLHAPLNENTRGLINVEAFKAMKSSCILINTSRGEIIDQKALYKALVEDKIFAAGLDVTSPEPLPKEHELYRLKNILILPHIGSATFEARSAMSILAAQNIINGLNKNYEEGSIINKKDLHP